MTNTMLLSARKLKNLNKVQFEYEREVICPYCGKEQMDSWELSGDDGEPDETECGSCGEGFSYVTHVEITYSTSQI